VSSDIISEFWPGELLDSLVLKPLLMGFWSKMFGVVGLIIWKYLADIVYYSLAAFLYQRKTKRRIDDKLLQLEKIMKSWN
jgi:hypothetical protein